MKLDPKKTAVVTLDLQRGILAMAEGYDSVISTAAKVVNFARSNNFFIIHVGLGFSEGYPEASEKNSMTQMLKQKNLFIKGTPSTEFHSDIVKPKDTIVYKHRISAFSENNLDLILRAQGIENLILFGVSTSGIVFSTVPRAFDLDYKITLIEDACFDIDSEVHRVLMEKVYPKRCTVIKSDEFIKVQGE